LQGHDFIILHSYDVSKGQYFSKICYYATLQHSNASDANVASASQSFMANSRLMQCFSKVFARGPLWFLKITTDPRILSHVNIERQDDRYPKLKKLYLRTDFRELRIHTNRIRNKVLHYLT